MALYKNTGFDDPPSWIGGLYNKAKDLYHNLKGDVYYGPPKSSSTSGTSGSPQTTYPPQFYVNKRPDQTSVTPQTTNPKPAYKSKYGYKSEIIFASYDPKTGQYNKYNYDGKNLASTDGYYPAGFRPALNAGKLSLYNEKNGQYYDIDDAGNPIEQAVENKTTEKDDVTNRSAVTNIDKMKTLGLDELLPKPPDVLPGGTKTPANDNYATIDSLNEADEDLLRKQKRLTTSQEIAGTLAELPWLMASLNGRAPDMIQPPTQYAPNIEYSNPIYEQGSRENKAALFGARDYLSQHGMQEMTPAMLADYYGAQNQANAQEAGARMTFLNENATNVANAQNQNELNLYNAKRDYAATIDALNTKREQVASSIMSQMLANYYGGENKKLAIEASGNKNNAIYEQMKKYIKDGDMASFNLLLSAYTGTKGNIYGSEPVKDASEWVKIVQGD